MLAKKEIAIIGCSISGSCLAYLLAPNFNVKVFEIKKESEIGKKICANIVTSEFLSVAKELKINAKKFIKNEFKKAKILTGKSKIEIETEDYEIARKKLIKFFIKKARERGARFFFQTDLIDIEKAGEKYLLLLEKNKENFNETADIIIGADGALSKVAKKSGLWQSRRFDFLMQAHTKRNVNKGNSYSIFLGSPFGYYSYLIEKRNEVIAGQVFPRKKYSQLYFKKFLKILQFKSEKFEAGIIPVYKPFLTKRKGNLFLIGDAACHTKATGGGIIQGLKDAIALEDFFLNKNKRKFREIERELLIQYIIRKIIERCNNNDFEELLKIIKRRKSLLKKSRDTFSKWVLKLIIMEPKLLLFLSKILPRI